MTSTEMKQARMLREVQLGSSVVDSVTAIPRTTAWNHNGTYMGECGVKLAGSRLHIVPGPYLSGFSSVTLNGAAMPLSLTAVEVAEGIYVSRTSHRIDIFTPLIRFSLVNSDKFVNVEKAAILQPYSPDLRIDGMLGQTADSKWTVQKSAHWRKHLEEDHLLLSNDIFGDDFSRSQYTGKL